MSIGYIDTEFAPEFLLPEGECLVKIEEIICETSTKGNPMIRFELRSIPDNEYLRHYCLNTGNNRWMLKKTLQAITGEEQPTGAVRIKIDDLINRRFKVEIEHETYQGKKRAKVKDVILPEQVSPGQTTLEEMIDDKSNDKNKQLFGDKDSDDLPF